MASAPYFATEHGRPVTDVFSEQLPITLSNIATAFPSIRICGHSYANGAGASISTLGYGMKVARASGALRQIYTGYSGSVSCHASTGQTGDGGWAWMLNTLGPINLTNSTPTPYGATTGKWGPRHSLLVHEHALNDIGWLGFNTQPMIEAHRTIWAAFSRSRLYQINGLNNPWTLTGTWTSSSYTYQQALGLGCKETSAVGSSAALTLDSDMPSGRVVHLGFTVLYGDVYTATIARNGTVIGQIAVDGTKMCDPAPTWQSQAFPGNGIVRRFGLPGSGLVLNPSDLITVTLTSLTSGSMRFNYAGVESDPLDGPVWAAVLPNRITAVGYAFYAASFPQGSVMTDHTIAAHARALTSLCAEFPGRAVPVDVNDLANVTPFPIGSFAVDGFHPNDDFHSSRAQRVLAALNRSGLLTTRVATALDAPVVPFWYSLGGTAAWGASSLLGTGLTNSWAQYDLPQTQFVAQYPGYRLNEAGKIELRGRFKSGASGTSIATIVQYGASSISRRYSCVAGIDDVWNVSSAATGGTFTLTVNGATTSAIAFNATALTVANALAALSGVGVGNVSVSGSLSAGFVITFIGALAGTPVTLTGDGTNLTGGTLTVTHTTTGSMQVIPVQVGAGSLGGGANTIVPFFSGSISWVDLSGVEYELDS